MPITWVGQEDRKGCGVACAAMLAGVSYQEAKRYFREQQPDAGEREVDTRAVLEYLSRHGWEKCGYRTFKYNSETGKFDDPGHEPIEGADVTLCVILPSMITAHAVVMLPDGTVLDPARCSPARLSDYPKVECLRGFRRKENPHVPELF